MTAQPPRAGLNFRHAHGTAISKVGAVAAASQRLHVAAGNEARARGERRLWFTTVRAQLCVDEGARAQRVRVWGGTQGSLRLGSDRMDRMAQPTTYLYHEPLPTWLLVDVP